MKIFLLLLIKNISVYQWFDQLSVRSKNKDLSKINCNDYIMVNAGLHFHSRNRIIVKISIMENTYFNPARVNNTQNKRGHSNVLPMKPGFNMRFCLFYVLLSGL